MNAASLRTAAAHPVPYIFSFNNKKFSFRGNFYTRSRRNECGFAAHGGSTSCALHLLI
jgi:hypothetical protein